jgi:hypothetical protein
MESLMKRTTSYSMAQDSRPLGLKKSMEDKLGYVISEIRALELAMFLIARDQMKVNRVGN